MSPSKREARVLFGFHGGMLIALYSFIKKDPGHAQRGFGAYARRCHREKEESSYRLDLRGVFSVRYHWDAFAHANCGVRVETLRTNRLRVFSRCSKVT